MEMEKDIKQEEVVSVSMLDESEDIIMKKIKDKKGKIFKIVQRNKKLDPISFVVYNRKEKSLEELSKRFMNCLIDYDEKIVCLDEITKQLGVERRRIYDIINILESLKLVTRKCKNQYIWKGFSTIYQTISEVNITKNPIIKYQDLKITQQKREKSLEVLSTGFIKLFMQEKNIWTLDEAAKILSQDDNKLKTKIRRLYDIANVLKSIGLIRKTHLDSRKPAFEWVGINGLENFYKQRKGHQLNVDKQNDQKSALGLNQIFETFMDHMIRSQISTEKKERKNSLVFNYQMQAPTPKVRKTLTLIEPPESTEQQKQ